MKSRNILAILLVLIVCTIAIGQVSANDVTNDNNNFTWLNQTVQENHNVELSSNVTLLDSETGSFSKGIVIDQNCTINGNGYCINANHKGRIFQITNNDTVLTLINVTLKNGYNVNYGGAIFSDGDVNLVCKNNVTFYNNTVGDYGGAIYAGNDVIITGTNGSIVFCNNTATSTDSAYGGAIYASIGVSISNVTGGIVFCNNTATTIGIDVGSAESCGGAIYASIDVSINNVTGSIVFCNNTVTAIGIDFGTAESNGGAIYVNIGGSVVISDVGGDVVFCNNTAAAVSIKGTTVAIGGAIYAIIIGGSVVISDVGGDVVFCNNTATSTSFSNGGAICTDDVVISDVGGDVVFFNNTSTGIGGAIYASIDVSINNVTGSIVFCNNTAKDGGAISTNTIHVNKNILIFNNNTATAGKNIYITNLINSDIDDCFWGLNYKNQQEIIDDELIYLKNNGYIAPNYWLLYGSIIPIDIAPNYNYTFKLVLNQRTNGVKNESIKTMPVIMPVNLTTSGGIIKQGVGYFNFTTNQTGDYTVNVYNIYNNEKITEINFKVGETNISVLADLIAKNTTINLDKNYDFYKTIDSNLIRGLQITKDTFINGNGHTINGKGMVSIFIVNKGAKLTLININLICDKVVIINNGVLTLNTASNGATKVTSNGYIINRGNITSKVIFTVMNQKVTTYDSYLVSLKTDSDIPIMVDNLKYSDDQGHNYNAYIFTKGFYVNYVPEGITGHVTFNNVELNGFTNLTSAGSLDIISYPNSNKVLSNVVKNIKDLIPVVKNKVVKSTLNLNTMFKSFNKKVMTFI